MLRDLYTRFCAGSLALSFVDGDQRQGFTLTPTFTDDGLLAGLEAKLVDLPDPEAPPAEAAAPQAAGVGEISDQANVNHAQPGIRAVPGATELDPITGQEVPKVAESA